MAKSQSYDEFVDKFKPKYTYPNNVLTVSAIAPLAPHVSISIPRSRLAFIRSLDAQREHKKAIFGGGYLIPDEEAHMIEEARSIKWSISERERIIVEGLQ